MCGGEGEEGAGAGPDGLGNPESLGTEEIFSASMSQSRMGEVITEVGVIVDVGAFAPSVLGFGL